VPAALPSTTKMVQSAGVGVGAAAIADGAARASSPSARADATVMAVLRRPPEIMRRGYAADAVHGSQDAPQ
jgi:hypothetical protein